MAKLRRLRIERFRNVVAGTEIRFHDGLNVVLGQNGTGKTSLLELCAMALSCDFSRLQDEELAIAYDLESPQGALGIDVQLRRDWSYRVRIEAPDHTELGRIEAGPLGARAVLPGAAEPVVIPNTPPHEPFFLGPALGQLVAYAADPDRGRIAGIHESARRIVDRFDEALGGFELMTGNGTANDHVSGGRYVAFLQYGDPSAPEQVSLVSDAVRVPEAVARHIEAEPVTVGDEHLILKHWGLTFLERTIRLCGFIDGHMTLARQALRPLPGGVEVRYGDLFFSFTLDDGTVLTHRELSYGEKRLLSFLYHLALNSDVVVADDLGNSLSADWIEACIQEIGDRQAFLTSRSPALLDLLPFESAEQVRRSVVRCRRERREGRSVMVWENLEAEAAEEIYRSYRTKALQVSEILRLQGLW